MLYNFFSFSLSIFFGHLDGGVGRGVLLPWLPIDARLIVLTNNKVVLGIIAYGVRVCTSTVSCY